MNKKLRLLVTALLTATVAVGGGWSPARADQSRSYIYIVHDSYFSPVRSVATPAGEIAPLGYFEVVPSGTTLRMHVDDHLTPDGQKVRVSMSSGGKRLFSGCMTVRTTVPVTGVRPGQPVFVLIGPLAYLGCGTPATAGVVTVSGVLG